MNRREIVRAMFALPVLPLATLEPTRSTSSFLFAPRQPQPASTLFETIGNVTAISRTWANGDQHRCRLCTTCAADERGMCLVVVQEQVAPEDVALYAMGEPTN
jgi:hypothetical protein